jgi:hypothetical protein
MPVDGTINRQKLKQYCIDHGYSDDTDRGIRNLEKLINNAWREVNQKYNWPFLTERISYQTKAPVNAGTASVNHNGTTVTGSGGTGWTTNDVGGLIFFASNETFYEVTAVSATNSLTIDPAFVDPDGSNQTNVQYDILFPIIAHPNNHRTLKKPQEGSYLWELKRIEVDNWLVWMLVGESTGTPLSYAVDGDNLYLWPAPEEQRIIYAYHFYFPDDMTDDTTTIEWPDALEYVLHRCLDKHMVLDRKQMDQYGIADREFEKSARMALHAVNPSVEGRVKHYEGVGEITAKQFRIPVKSIQS